jgi:hypothetical protein
VPFVHDEKHIDLIERVDRLDRHVIGITRADADNKNFSHDVSPVYDVRSPGMRLPD